jgi:hypothetical protein
MYLNSVLVFSTIVEFIPKSGHRTQDLCNLKQENAKQRQSYIVEFKHKAVALGN